MRVREAAFVALARARDKESLALAARACRHDRSFRVRRMAAIFAARACGPDASGVLAIASRDPFWRVRVAARRAAAALDVVVDVSNPELSSAITPTAIPAIDDPDPAVMTARLANARGEVRPRDLVGLLGQSHAALRRIAVVELAARADLDTLRAVTRWLVDERVPYGPAAAEAVLAGSGARAIDLAHALLELENEPSGVTAWALRIATACPWPRVRALVEHDDERVRRAAFPHVLRAASDRAELFATVIELLGDVDEAVRERAAEWLASTGSREGRDALRKLDPAAQPTAVRALLVDLHTSSRDVHALRRFSSDEHAGVRAAAIRTLLALDALSESERRDGSTDPDPWVRAAVLNCRTRT